MKSLKFAITIIALVATAFIYGPASAESITVKMESMHKDSVKHLFQPFMPGGLAISRMTEGLPEIQSVAGLDIDAPLHARLSFFDSPAEPIVIMGLDSDGQDIAFAAADSTAQPQRLQLTTGSFDGVPADDALRAELTVPSAGQASEFKIELFIIRERNLVMYRNLELRLGEADIGGQRYAIALVRSPRFGAYSPLADSLGRTSHDILIDRDGDGVFLTYMLGTEELEDETFEIFNPFILDDQVYKLADVSATGDRLVIEPSDQTVALAVGFEMPNVTVTRLDSSAIDLTALRGKPVVINWWHTACSPCIAEMPELNELVEKYEGRDVEFLAIANNEIEELTPFLKKHPFIYDIAVANDEATRILGTSYPRHVIVNYEGKVVLDITGLSSNTVDQIDTAIGSLLNEL